MRICTSAMADEDVESSAKILQSPHTLKSRSHSAALSAGVVHQDEVVTKQYMFLFYKRKGENMCRGGRIDRWPVLPPSHL